LIHSKRSGRFNREDRGKGRLIDFDLLGGRGLEGPTERRC
jgi:hypothetical protein